LRKPGPIAAQIGEPWIILLLWTAVGIYALLGVLCAIELAISMPQAGAWYVLRQEGFWKLFRICHRYYKLVGYCISIGVGAYTMSEYIALLLPSTEGYIQLISVALLAALTGFHWLGTKSAGKSQEILAVIKAVGLLLFVAVCFIYGKAPQGTQLAQTVGDTMAPLTFISVIAACKQYFTHMMDGTQLLLH
jgi:APA family basic amino acid/polyamine antiporter